jgi:long-subunit fatty acid transport protein
MSEIKQWEFYLDPEFYEEFSDYWGSKPDYGREGIDLNMRNTSRIMFGIEYHLRNFIAFRAGYTYQKSCVDGQMLHPVFPDLDTNVLSFGIGYEGPMFSAYSYDKKIGGLSIDAYFQYGFSPSRTSVLTEFPAVYQSSRWIVGLGVGFNF